MTSLTSSARRYRAQISQQLSPWKHTQEHAAYISKSTREDITSLYTKSVDAARYSEASRRENNTAADNLPQVSTN